MAEDGELESTGGGVLFLHPTLSSMTATPNARRTHSQHAARRGLAHDTKPAADAESLQRNACRIIAATDFQNQRWSQVQITAVAEIGTASTDP